MTNDEIERVLSSKINGKIIDFVLNYNFKDNFDELYLNFLLNFEYKKRNSHLASYVIDIAYYKKIKNEKLVELFRNLLSEKINYFIKLSILDYFKDVNVKLTKSELIKLQNDNKYSYRTLKMEIILTNIYYKFEIEKNIDLILIKLKRRDCSHIELIRVLEIFNSNKVLKVIKQLLIKKNLLLQFKTEFIYYNVKFSSINDRFDRFVLLYLN